MKYLKLLISKFFKDNRRKMTDELLYMFEFYKISFELIQEPTIVLENSKIVKFNFKALKLFGATNGNDLGNHSFCEFHVYKPLDKLNNPLTCGNICKTKNQVFYKDEIIKKITGEQILIDMLIIPTVMNGRNLTFIIFREKSTLI